jgi:chromosome segregation ATPase
MIAPTPKPDQPLENRRSAGEGESSKKLLNPNLTGSLVADYDALQNDLRQAQDLAADFQRQLAGKSNEHAQLKQILEKTQADLVHLQDGIVELRAERHRLANEAMRAAAYQAKLGTVTGERDRLRVELEVVRVALKRSAQEMESQVIDRDRRIAELAVEVVVLKQELEEAREALRAILSAPPPVTGR